MLRISAKTGNMAARLRPARTQQYGARLRLSPRTSAKAVSTARFAPASQNTPTSLTKPIWSETSASGCGRCCRSRPCTHRVAALALRSAVEDSESLACAIATAPGNESSRPGQRHRLRGWLSRTTGEAYGARSCAPVASPCSPVLHTTHIVRSFRSFLAPHIYSCRAATPRFACAPLRGKNVAQYGVV